VLIRYLVSQNAKFIIAIFWKIVGYWLTDF